MSETLKERIERHAKGGPNDIISVFASDILELINSEVEKATKPRYVQGKRFTHCVDSYGTRIYEDDEILDEVAGTTDFVIYHKGLWYLGRKYGLVLSGQLTAHLQRKCKVVDS